MYASDRRDVALRISSLAKELTCMTNLLYEVVGRDMFHRAELGTERVVDACIHIRGFARVTERLHRMSQRHIFCLAALRKQVYTDGVI
jgi:hypothetical protein